MDELMNLAFKAFGVFDFGDGTDEDFMYFDQLEWFHPRMVKPNELEGIMRDAYELAKDDAARNYHWFTVVAYEMNQPDNHPPLARYATDYDRRYPGSVDRFCNDYTGEISNEIVVL